MSVKENFSLSIDTILGYSSATYSAIVMEEFNRGNVDVAIGLIATRLLKKERETSWAISVGSEISKSLIIDGNLDDLKKLHDTFLAVKIKLDYGLSSAIITGNSKIFEYLIDCGLDVEKAEISASGTISFSKNNQEEIVKIRSAIGGYQFIQPLILSTILERTDMFEIILAKTNFEGVTYKNLSELIETASKCLDSSFLEKLCSNKSVQFELKKEWAEGLRSKKYNSYGCIKKISMLPKDQQDVFLNFLESSTEDGRDSPIKVAWGDQTFRQRLITYMPKKYIELKNRFNANEVVQKDLSEIVSNGSLELISILYHSDEKLFINMEEVDYPKSDRRLKRNIGPLQKNILLGREDVSYFLGAKKEIYDKEIRAIEEYKKNGWLLTRGDGIYQGNQLSTKTDEREEKANSLWEGIKLKTMVSKKHEEAATKRISI